MNVEREVSEVVFELIGASPEEKDDIITAVYSGAYSVTGSEEVARAAMLNIIGKYREVELH